MREQLMETRRNITDAFREVRGKEGSEKLKEKYDKELSEITELIDKLNKESFEENIEKLDSLKDSIDNSNLKMKDSIKEIKSLDDKFKKVEEILGYAEETIKFVKEYI